MADLRVTAVESIGDDRLRVSASDGVNDYTAEGWVSATRNHYDASSYGDDGHLIEGAEARTMTPDEVGAYALSLVLEQHPELAQEARPVNFTAQGE